MIILKAGIISSTTKQRKKRFESFIGRNQMNAAADRQNMETKLKSYR